MLEGTIVCPTTEIEDQEEIQGNLEFSWKEILVGIFAGGREFSDRLNEAIEEAYNL